EVRARALAQKLYDGLPPRRVTAGRAAQGLAERSGHYVDARGDTTVFRGAAPTLADEADRVGIVDHDQRAMLVGEFADGAQVGDDAGHREHAVRCDELEARARGVGFAEPRFEVGHVVVAIAIALRLAQPDAVDDAGVIELVADDGVFFAEQRLEEATVGVEA